MQRYRAAMLSANRGVFHFAFFILHYLLSALSLRLSSAA
jgi:hypothetical protein